MDKLKKLSLTELRKTKEYKDIPREYKKSKLSKKDLLKVIKKLFYTRKVSSSKKSSISKKIDYKKKYAGINTDYKNIGVMKEQDKLLDKYHLPSQKDYLVNLAKTYDYLNSKN